MKTQVKRRQITEESVESKPRNTVPEPTTVSSEVKNLWKSMLKRTQEDIVGGSLKSASEQLLGSSRPKQEEYLIEGNIVSLDKYRQAKDAREKRAEEKPQVSMEHMSYFRRVENADNFAESKVETEVKQRVEEIRLEIKRLVKTSKIVERTVKDATADQAPVRPGKYHLSFFEFVLSVIRDATRKLEDSVSYGAVFTSKKQQSKYWSKYKKHGTTFGLSGERTTATQTG
ncbi:MAG: hypothetical protein ACD_50C00286G0001 [uncultured bacterium]|nr:MAG: hypothetical protein ACD_50C00286G0001 [uncultured bacterium]KKQ95134.1 MAG: hypothetical protein UT20_C0030G0018 [Candidatus Levybacteria bacterium GW2011_GWA1_39_11]KKR25343.1 MAG: hypothetical protein UT56_C0001G0074 [Candidatus Levybacteria bacterium GW2011_GWB1_39_7]KKR25568.1 MAG: hypothetical protein UT57_C0063G0001 [Microgenomates group bacterium GW2011_GWC1_39_7]KKR50410.1 MAG: hypothetical protein UT85_C0002G0018 [Candidatus Levybacteria bacterium GW2011_GWA2_40_16]OGH15443.1